MLRKLTADVIETIIPVSLKAKTGNFSRREEAKQDK
jgi:hypothetical protein